jgi:hypothetical protein
VDVVTGVAALPIKNIQFDVEVRNQPSMAKDVELVGLAPTGKVAKLDPLQPDGAFPNRPAAKVSVPEIVPL